MWFILALGASAFAVLTPILAKIGIKGVDSNLATVIRTFAGQFGTGTLWMVL